MNTFNLCDNSMWKSGNVFLQEGDVFVLYTVNPEIFARVLLLRNFAYAKFRENKTHAK